MGDAYTVSGLVQLTPSCLHWMYVAFPCLNHIVVRHPFLTTILSTQQTMTRDFTCSVSEFMSSTGSIHMFPYVNSPDSVNKFGVSTHVYHEIMSFQHDDMCK